MLAEGAVETQSRYEAASTELQAQESRNARANLGPASNEPSVVNQSPLTGDELGSFTPTTPSSPESVAGPGPVPDDLARARTEIMQQYPGLANASPAEQEYIMGLLTGQIREDEEGPTLPELTEFEDPPVLEPEIPVTPPPPPEEGPGEPLGDETDFGDGAEETGEEEIGTESDGTNGELTPEQLQQLLENEGSNQQPTETPNEDDELGDYGTFDRRNSGPLGEFLPDGPSGFYTAEPTRPQNPPADDDEGDFADPNIGPPANGQSTTSAGTGGGSSTSSVDPNAFNRGMNRFDAQRNFRVDADYPQANRLTRALNEYRRALEEMRRIQAARQRAHELAQWQRYVQQMQQQYLAQQQAYNNWLAAQQRQHAQPQYYVPQQSGGGHHQTQLIQDQ
jgi:hypothetical protein